MIIKIREHTQDDIEQLKVVSQEMHASMRKVYFPNQNAKKIGTDVPFVRLVVLCDEKIVGMVTYENNGDSLYFGGLGFLLAYRKKGISRNVISYLEGVARDLEFNKLSCATIEETGNVEIFKRLGFTVISREVTDKFVGVDQGIVHEVRLEKTLPLKNVVSLRKANSADARGIAFVHYQSWIETYTGLMPDGLLEKISLEGREKLWSMILADPKRCVWIAETSEGEIVGFLSVCPGRDERYKDYGEIPGLYLLKKYHSQGIGASLLRKGIALLKEQGFKSVYLWVLKDNPAELFYQKMGGKMDGEQELELDGYKMIEVFYVWKDLR